MSGIITGIVLQCFRPDGDGARRQRDIALAIADACPDETGERMYKAVETLAHFAFVSKSTAKRALGELVQLGWLEVVRGGGHGPGSSTMYRISAAWLRAATAEIAQAYSEGRRTRGVEINIEKLTGVFDAKGFNLNPLEDELRGSKTGVKGFNHVNPKR